MADFGVDISALPDLDFGLKSGLPNLAEAIARRYITPRGALWYAPGYGLDLRRYLNEAMTPELLEEMRILVEQEAEKDPRVRFAEARVALEPGHRVRVALRLETDEGPVDLVLSVDRVSVEVLHAYPG